MIKYKQLHLILFVVAIFIAGCSTTRQASEVKSIHIAASQYKGFSCDELFAEAEKIRASVPGLEAQVDAQYKSDKTAEQVGWWLLWPALFFMDGEGAEHSQLALARGQLEAIQSAAIIAKCFQNN